MRSQRAIPPKEEIIAIFDQLVAEGIVLYGPYRTIVRDADGYPVPDPIPAQEPALYIR